MYRFNLKMPTDLFNTIDALAHEQGISNTQMMIHFFKVGLLLYQHRANGGDVILRKDGVDTNVIFL